MVTRYVKFVLSRPEMMKSYFLCLTLREEEGPGTVEVLQSEPWYNIISGLLFVYFLCPPVVSCVSYRALTVSNEVMKI